MGGFPELSKVLPEGTVVILKTKARHILADVGPNRNYRCQSYGFWVEHDPI